ncbi:uncharacterized protein I206_102672 [Kwoniella pini CBS 10737]|uniref:CAMK/CAMKL protein kinase n=1 Tax=Kwoniella pini CBS 10737 TaxID=1296096 RepID=A0A1B9I611_9TREE|nr:CAMK/CAMKL protein kinase [Kwoniella pini CBS 10737]OCF50963.1 CAMK/CAMKL protein kinase [Kwoniella pini CBS 10737]
MSKENTPRSTLTHIGGWKLGKTLGRGAYAHVRLATHANGHKAACKILPALHHTLGRKVSRDETIDAIEAHKELVLLKGLSGAGVPGIVGLEGVIVEGGWTYVFLTLYPASASAYVTPWNYDHFVCFFRRLLYIVDILHNLNISHEDLKRSNVLIDEYGTPAVVDFGFSHFRPNGGYVRSAGGTLDYSSPQKAADDLYEPTANDVWALGILATKLLGISHPYTHRDEDEDSSTIKDRIIEGGARFRFSSKYTGPDGIAELILGMLDRDPIYRWTIPQILLHPSLQTDFPDPLPFKLPSFELSYMHRIDESVIEDICFLAYLDHQFYLCETPLKIIRRLQGREPCWEKRWASMLGAWSKRSEMDWEDIPVAITPLRARSAPTMRSAVKIEKYAGRALKEIHLTPNINKPFVKVAKTPKVNEKKQRENMPPTRPRKSRMYGMKTKEESMRSVLGDVKAQEPKKVDVKKAKPDIKLRKGTQSEELGASPKKDEKTATKRDPHQNKAKAQAKKFVIHDDEAETSVEPSAASKTLINRRSLASSKFQSLYTLTVPGSCEEDAIVVDGSPLLVKNDRTRVSIAKMGKPRRAIKPRAAPTNIRSVVKGKESGTATTTSSTGSHLKNLNLAPSGPKGARRRSPRLASGEEISSLA